MYAYKLEVLIIDEDVESVQEAIDIIEETRYPNHTSVTVVTCKEADIGSWHDDHHLNFTDTREQAMKDLFN